MKNRSILITAKKELRSILRDKKAIITILLFPIIIPIMIFFYAYIYDESTTEEYYNIAINYEPTEIESTLLETYNLLPTYYNTIEEMETAYNKKEISGYINYNTTKKNYTIYANTESEEGNYVVSYITSYLDNYNTYLTNQILQNQGIDVNQISTNLTYSIEDLEGENFLLETIFSVSFTYIIMSIVLACTNMATSATAVEKENGTLETILTFPVTPKELIIGKYLSAFIIGFASSLIGFILTIISLIIATNLFTIFESISISITKESIIIGLVICLLASLFIAGLSLAITANAKSYKEAQSSSQVLSILTIIPMLISLIDIDIKTIYYLIPIANYVQILMDIFSKSINYQNIIAVLTSTIIYVIIVISIINHQYKKEKILFSN